MEVFALQEVRFLKASPNLDEISSRTPGTFEKLAGESSAQNNEKMKSMKMFLFSAALVLVASSNGHATEALLFNGGGYFIDILIGMTPDPVIALSSLYASRSEDWVSLPRKFLHIEKVRHGKAHLTMHF